VIHENARQWHKLIPLFVWSFREVTNDTTSVPPCLLMHDRLPRGPLSLIKETCTGGRALPSTLPKSETQYMSHLKRNLRLAHDLPNEHSTPAQAKYVQSHNARAQDKHFQAVDQVIVLEPDSTHKLISQWQTGVVAKVCSPYSYLVYMSVGSRRHMHANKLRPLIAKVQTVIHQRDADFGRILTVPTTKDQVELPSKGINLSSLSHSLHDEPQAILALLDEFSDCFLKHPVFVILLNTTLSRPNGRPRHKYTEPFLDINNQC
jgi:hypothetical protein